VSHGFGFGFEPGSGFEGGPEPSDVQVQINQVALVMAIARVIPGSTLVPPVAKWLASYGVTLGATLKEVGGSSPPVVTLSGTLALNTTALRGAGGIRVIFGLGGARGTATFDVSYDNGATWAHTGELTAATYNLDGDATGLVLNFPTGTYSTLHTYEATVQSWESAEGYIATNATAAEQPIYKVAGVDSGPSLLFDGSNDRLIGTDAEVIAPFTDGNTFTLFCRHKFTTADRNGFYFSAANSASANGSRRFGQTATGNGRHCDFYTNDAASANLSIRTSPELDTSAHLVEWYFESNLSTCITDGGTANPNAASFTPGTLTPNRYCIGANGDSVPDTFHAGHISQLVIWDSKLNTTQAADWRTELS
jgi:hypothetical protein